MLGLLDRLHAFVLFQRFRNRSHSRVTDKAAAETARIAMNTQEEGSGDSVRPKEDATQVVMQGVFARAGLLNILHRVVSEPTEGIGQVVYCSWCWCWCWYLGHGEI